MQLCLSARMFALPGTSNRFELDVEAFTEFAKSAGYDGITLRSGQLDPTTAAEEVGRIASALKRNDMVCSFVMCGTVGDQDGYSAQCRLVDHVLELDCRHIQPSVRDESEILWIQKLCDYAAERDVRIAPQLHNNTLHDTVPRCKDLFAKVDRENFGLNFEASHLLMQDAEIQGSGAVEALSEKIFTVCVQNYKMADGENLPVLPGDPDGVDFGDVFGALKSIGFDGFVTHMSGPYPDMDNRAVCEAFVERLRPLL